MLILPKLTLVTGGAASGKSHYAERLIASSGLPKKYFATSQIWDDEMAEKVRAHRTSSADDGWDTVETGTDLTAAINTVSPGEAVLIDCATMWLTAIMMADGDTAKEVTQVLKALSQSPAPFVIVTNEVGQGIVPDTSMGRAFRNIQGRFNQAAARQADSVIAVMSGLPFALKGTLPEVPQ